MKGSLIILLYFFITYHVYHFSGNIMYDLKEVSYATISWVIIMLMAIFSINRCVYEGYSTEYRILQLVLIFRSLVLLHDMFVKN